eukprot:gnl/MRDRNA2_/MRDRNA2_28465_c0_seq2.p1 gnl/MRDRNA2_/MRDRNA2_28465_c0~~gnl/MRDRNA2_/MRDRNA2_28465_c0_seq2.p1  ORF type:complete len:182 (+),score=33.34 gnl/MRDRNA2_/MRDRNA2_28465_c0_seq2:102-647(+)
MALQCLSKMAIHIHPQSGGMCCSPNNCRILLNAGSTEDTNVATLWSVAVEDATSAPRACVTLHWAMVKENPVLESLLDDSESLEAFLASASQVLAGAPLRALLVAFKRAAPESLGPPETEAMASQRKDANGPGEKGGGGKRGGYSGKGTGKGNQPYSDSRGVSQGQSKGGGKGNKGGGRWR